MANIALRDWHGLLQPLAVGQGAPPLWLLFERLVYVTHGSGERGMRLLPLALGCAGLALLALLAGHALRATGALVATALAAFSPTLVHYSNQVKQYSSDFCAGSALLLGALILIRRPRITVRVALLWWSGATLAATMSQPSILLTAALSATLFARIVLRRNGWSGQVRRRTATEAVTFLAPSVAWIGVCLWMYFTTLREVSSTEYIKDYWQAGYPPQGGRLSATVEWLLDVALRFGSDVLLAPVPWIAVGLLVTGAVLLCRKRPRAAAVLLAPVVMAYVVAILGLFPLQQRMTLWFAPAVFLFLGAATTVGGARARTRVVAILCVAAALASLAAPYATRTAHDVIHPMTIDLADPPAVNDIPSALQYVSTHRRPHDVLLAGYAQAWTVLYYAGTRYDMRMTGMLSYEESGRCEPTAAEAELPPAQRLWVIAGPVWHSPSIDIERVYLAYLRTLGHVRVRQFDRNTQLYLVDRSMPPDDPTGTFPALPEAYEFGCMSYRGFPNWFGR